VDHSWPGLVRRLEGRLVSLEPLARTHEAGLREAARETEIWRWMPVRLTEDAAFDAWLEAALAEPAFATVDNANGKPLGSTRFMALRPEHRSLEIGHTWLAPAAWGTGANVEAKLLMLEHAFERLGCARVEFKTDERNERSRGALEALGARLEGVHRKHMVVPYSDGVRNSAYYSIVDDEWPDVKSRLEARLKR
jgi:RimJ/RimL family protein N-acetyltransferase